jgi:hypothetical protein
MAEQLTAIEKNCTTGEEIIRPFTEQETADHYKNIEDYKAQEATRLAEAQAKAEAKASALAKLEALGLTEEEANALIS